MVTKFTLIVVRYYGCQGSQVVNKTGDQLALKENKLS